MQDEWFKINAPYGKELGYPDCCIKEFCDQPPELLKNKNPTKDEVNRFYSGFLNDKFTGFIPCKFHANEISAGKITLSSLIKNRNIFFSEFPNQ